MLKNLPEDKIDKIQKVLQCFYCGNSTLMDLVGEHKYNWDEGEGYYGYFIYQMFSCPICGKVTFFQQYWDCNMFLDDERTFIYEEILYPINKFSEKNIPAKVKDAYEAALKTRNIDSAICLISLRRTLEIICNEKKKQQGEICGTKSKICQKKAYYHQN